MTKLELETLNNTRDQESTRKELARELRALLDATQTALDALGDTNHKGELRSVSAIPMTFVGSCGERVLETHRRACALRETGRLLAYLGRPEEV